MKKILIILGLFLVQNAIAIEKIYLQQPTNYSHMRPTYNPYSKNLYYSPYRYRNTNYNDEKRLQKINKIRRLNRVNNLINNLNGTGSLTGYSVPINQNAYSLFDTNSFNHRNPNLTTDIFSTPTGYKGYYRNGEWVNDNGGLSSKTGVKIIYD